MMRAVIASANPAKVKAAANVLKAIDPSIAVESMETESGVSAQPFSAEETRQGAVNRAKSALAATQADLAVGLEGGVYEMAGTLYLCNWGALAVREGPIFTAGGAQIPLPETISRELKKGRELGPVMDEFADETGIRRHKGAIGILTAGFINRQRMFEEIVRLLAGQYRFSRHSVATNPDEH